MLVFCWFRRVCSEINELFNVVIVLFCVENMLVRFDEVIVNMLFVLDIVIFIELLVNEFVFEYEKFCDGLFVLLVVEF